MRFLAMSLCLMTSVCFAQGQLSFKGGALRANLSWIKAPVAGEEAKMRVDFKDDQGRVAQINGTFSAVLWMPSMGHGSAPTSLLPFRDSQGQFVRGSVQINNMFFVMPGLWEVRFTLVNDQGVGETQVMEVDVENEYGHP